MASDTAAAANASIQEAADGTHSRGRQLWQAPVFVAGVALLAFVVTTRLIGTPDPMRLFERDLQTVRQALERPSGDVQAALAAGERALAAAPETRRGEALFLLGSVHLFLAGKSNG